MADELFITKAALMRKVDELRVSAEKLDGDDLIRAYKIIGPIAEYPCGFKITGPIQVIPDLTGITTTIRGPIVDPPIEDQDPVVVDPDSTPSPPGSAAKVKCPHCHHEISVKLS